MIDNPSFMTLRLFGMAGFTYRIREKKTPPQWSMKRGPCMAKL